MTKRRVPFNCVCVRISSGAIYGDDVAGLYYDPKRGILDIIQALALVVLALVLRKTCTAMQLASGILALALERPDKNGVWLSAA